MIGTLKMKLLTTIDGVSVDRTHEGDTFIYTHNPLDTKVGDCYEVIYSPRNWVLPDSIHRQWAIVGFEVVRSFTPDYNAPKEGKRFKMIPADMVRVISERVLNDDEISWCLWLIERAEAQVIEA